MNSTGIILLFLSALCGASIAAGVDAVGFKQRLLLAKDICSDVEVKCADAFLCSLLFGNESQTEGRVIHN